MDGNETNYLYDKKGQLIRENNKKMNYTMIFEYDNEGNILKRTKYPYSKNQLGNIVFERKYTYSNDRHGERFIIKNIMDKKLHMIR